MVNHRVLYSTDFRAQDLLVDYTSRHITDPMPKGLMNLYAITMPVMVEHTRKKLPDCKTSHYPNEKQTVSVQSLRKKRKFCTNILEKYQFYIYNVTDAVACKKNID